VNPAAAGFPFEARMGFARAVRRCGAMLAWLVGRKPQSVLEFYCNGNVR
jgi:hypothetical protein